MGFKQKSYAPNGTALPTGSVPAVNVIEDGQRRFVSTLEKNQITVNKFDVDNIKTALPTKADQTALTAMQTVVGNKAEQSVVTALQTTVAGKSDLGHTHIASQIIDFATRVDALIASKLTAEKMNPNGIATLDGNGLVPLAQLPASAKENRVVQTIAQRNALQAFEGLYCYVVDVNGNGTGGASYIHDGNGWQLVSAGNNMAAVQDWSNIVGKPSSTPAQLDNAATKAHEHTNKALLDTYDQANASIKDAVQKRHEHTNKALLDTYDQANAAIKDAVDKKHEHANKALLDTYDQLNVNITDAVLKRHEHVNKTTLDRLGINAGNQLTIDGTALQTGGGAWVAFTI